MLLAHPTTIFLFAPWSVWLKIFSDKKPHCDRNPSALLGQEHHLECFGPWTLGDPGETFISIPHLTILASLIPFGQKKGQDYCSDFARYHAVPTDYRYDWPTFPVVQEGEQGDVDSQQATPGIVGLTHTQSNIGQDCTEERIWVRLLPPYCDRGKVDKILSPVLQCLWGMFLHLKSSYSTILMLYYETIKFLKLFEPHLFILSIII